MVQSSAAVAPSVNRPEKGLSKDVQLSSCEFESQSRHKVVRIIIVMLCHGAKCKNK